MFKKGEIVGIVKLKNSYDGHVFSVLSDYFKDAGAKTARRTFKILKDMPSKIEYLVMRDKKYMVKMGEAISGAINDLEELKQELQDWYDNLPESFQSGDKGQELEDAINDLEQAATEIEVPDWLAGLPVLCLPGLKVESRADRCDAAVADLQACWDYLHTAHDSFTEKSNRDDVESLMRELDSALEASQVSFPGMY